MVRCAAGDRFPFALLPCGGVFGRQPEERCFFGVDLPSFAVCGSAGIQGGEAVDVDVAVLTAGLVEMCLGPVGQVPACGAPQERFSGCDWLGGW